MDVQLHRPMAALRSRPLALAGSTALATVLLAGLTACGGSGSGGSSASSAIGSSGGAPVDQTAPKAAAGPGLAQAGGSGASDSSDSAGSSANTLRAEPAGQLLQDRRLILNSGVTVVVGNVGDAAARARSLAAAAGGYVGDEDTTGTGTAARSTMTLRIPQDRLSSVTNQVAALGSVRARTQTSEDVTQQSVDVTSRLATQRASVARIRTLLAQATKISDIVLIEGELSNRESNLESLEAQLKNLNDSVDLATLTVSLSHEGEAKKAAPSHSGFLGGLGQGWDAFGAALVVALTVVGAVLPFAVLLALLGLPAYLVWRRRQTRHGPVSPAPAAVVTEP